MNRYPWEWGLEWWTSMADRNLLRIIPPDLADRLLRRRSGRWLLRGEDASGVLATIPKSERCGR